MWGNYNSSKRPAFIGMWQAFIEHHPRYFLTILFHRPQKCSSTRTNYRTSHHPVSCLRLSPSHIYVHPVLSLRVSPPISPSNFDHLSINQFALPVSRNILYTSVIRLLAYSFTTSHSSRHRLAVQTPFAICHPRSNRPQLHFAHSSYLLPSTSYSSTLGRSGTGAWKIKRCFRCNISNRFSRSWGPTIWSSPVFAWCRSPASAYRRLFFWTSRCSIFPVRWS